MCCRVLRKISPEYEKSFEPICAGLKLKWGNEEEGTGPDDDDYDDDVERMKAGEKGKGDFFVQLCKMSLVFFFYISGSFISKQ